MARIRIVDAWLRCPTAPLARQRAIMVVAEAWAEQRVLMRAYAESPDQTRPTIVLHGTQYAIGPAGPDPHGSWGIHVEPPADGRAQALRTELELAARRLAGSKGNPPRLMDEESDFDRKRTNYWAPGAPRDLPPSPAASPAPPAARAPGGVGPSYYEPNAAPGRAGMARGSTVYGFARAGEASTGHPAARHGWDDRDAARRGRDDRGAPPHAARHDDDGDRPTSAPRRRRFGSLVGRTMPLGLRLTAVEYQVLDALDAARVLTAARIGEIVGTPNGAAWMDALIAKLRGCGLDLIVAARDGNGEPTYVLRG